MKDSVLVYVWCDDEVRNPSLRRPCHRCGVPLLFSLADVFDVEFRVAGSAYLLLCVECGRELNMELPYA